MSAGGFLFTLKLKNMYYSSFLLIVSLLFTTTIFAQHKAENAEKVFDYHAKQYEFEGGILLAQGGEIIYKNTVGWADRTADIPLTPQARFGIASITKSFTAVLIFQLIAEGKVQLDDPITNYIDDLDVKGLEKVTVGNCLTHSSGLGVEPAIGYLKVQSPLEMLQKYARKKIKTTPGTRFEYSNLEYMALGLVVEKVTGKPWSKALEERILTPAGMSNTGVLFKNEQPENLAKTYHKTSGEFEADKPFYIENIYAAGAMYSTLEDIFLFDKALHDETILSAEMQQLMNTSFPKLSYVSYGNWAYGFPFVEGMPLTIERRGGIKGFNGVIMRFPEANKLLVILSNNGQFNPDTWGDASNIKYQLVKVLFDEAVDGVGD